MLYYEATAGCGVWGVGVLMRTRTAPCLSPWVAQRCGRAPRCPSAPIRYSSYAHWPHPYPLLRRPSSTLIVIHIPYSHPSRLPRPRPPRRFIVPAGLACPSPHPSFIPCFHTPSRCGILFRRGFRRPWLCTGCMVVLLYLALLLLLSSPSLRRGSLASSSTTSSCSHHASLRGLDECGLPLEDFAECWCSGGLSSSLPSHLRAAIMFFLLKTANVGFHRKTLLNVGALEALVAAAHYLFITSSWWYRRMWCSGGLGSRRSLLLLDKLGISLEDFAEFWRSGCLRSC